MSKALEPFYVVILAGGGGSRLWPKSRTDTPKQFLKLINKTTLIRDTYDRLASLVPADHIYVVTADLYKEEVARELPEVKLSHILAEPQPKSTAIAIGLATVVIQREDKDAIIGTFASDHTVKTPDKFRKVVKAVVEATSLGNHILTIGIKPTRPHTGFGYIHLGQKVFDVLDESIYKVKEFVEKPNLDTAKKYMESGKYLWNASYFFFKADTMLSAIYEFMPHLKSSLDSLSQAWGLQTWESTLRRVYKTVKEEPIEYGVLEKAQNILVARGDFDWSDVGDWSVIYELVNNKTNANVVIGNQSAPFVPIDTEGCLVYGDGRLVATVGLKDVVVVDTKDAVMICPRNRTQEVRKIVETLKKQNKRNFI